MEEIQQEENMVTHSEDSEESFIRLDLESEFGYDCTLSDSDNSLDFDKSSEGGYYKL